MSSKTSSKPEGEFMTRHARGYRLSPQQKRGWLLHQRAAIYYSQCVIRIEEVLDKSRLQRAVDTIVRRHEVLRTTFYRLPGKTTPVQQIHDRRDPSFSEGVMIETAGSGQSRDVDALLKREREEGCDLEQGPLIRVRLVGLSPLNHLLIITLPSICADAASLRFIANELERHYRAKDGQDEQDGTSVPYVQFSEWQLEMLEGAEAEELRKQIAVGGDATELRLPFEMAPPTSALEPQQFDPHEFELVLSEEVTAKVKRVAVEFETTAEIILLACWQSLLWKLTGREESITGVLFDGRKYQELKGAIGPYSKWLPIGNHFDDDSGFNDLVRQAHAATERARELLEYWVDEGRGNSSARLEFAVGFEYERTAPGGTTPAGFSIYKHRALIEPFKLRLRCLDAGAIVTLEIGVDRRVVSSNSMALLADEFRTLLENALNDPDKRIVDLGIISAERLLELAIRLNDTAVDHPKAASAHGLVQIQALRSPDSIALEDNDRAFSHGMLDDEANRVADWLRHCGVGPETVVGLCVERSAEMVVSMLGIMKAGGGYLPLENALPAERLAYMLADSGAAAAVTSQALREKFEYSDIPVICIDRQPEKEVMPRCPPQVEVSPDNLAYVIYTSGSTGRPKGVMVTHRGLVNYLGWGWQAYRPEEGGGALVHSPLAFDLTVTSLWLPLISGSRAVLVSEEKGVEGLSKALSAGRDFSLLKITPAHLEVLSHNLDPKEGKVRTIVVGGEALTGERLRTWQIDAIDTRLINEYGPTETVVGCSTYEIKEEITGGVPIGKPIWNTRMYVLDSQMRVVGIGEAGEICIGGQGLARGYLNRPEMTAEKFIPEAVGPNASQRLYATGDLGRYRIDGLIEFLGRRDYQVKVRGFRVELGEIEEVIKEVEGVKASVVVVRGEGADKRLVGYVVRDPEKRSGIREVSEYLKRKLPDYMLPKAIIEIKHLPLTSNGKVDKGAVPTEEIARPDLGHEYVEPRTPVEEILAAVWSEVLGIRDIGIHDSFFALGGDSIRSVRVVALSTERGLNYSVENLFQHQTIAELVAELQTANADAAPIHSEPFCLVSDEDRRKLPDHVENAYPLTVLQAGMLYHLEATPEAPPYHNVNSYHLKARFDLDKFREAVQVVVARHAVLRTSFDFASYSEPLQLVHKHAVLPIGVEDVHHLGRDGQDKVIADYVESERLRVFDLSRPPLLRLQFHPRSEETFQFTWTECHAVLDGWSTTSTFAECFSHYFALLDERTPPEVNLTTTFHDYVLLERRAMASEKCRDYWTRKLSGYSPVKLPRWPLPARSPGGPKMPRLDFAIPDELFEGLKRLARSQAVPFKSVVLAAHLKVMSMLTGRADLVTGIVSSARPEKLDGDRVRGLFLNTLPLRVCVEPGTWAELVRTVFEAEREFMPYRHYPMGAVQRQWGRQRLFEMTFNYLRFHSVEELAKSGDLEFLPDGNIESAETSFLLTSTFFSSPIASKLGLVMQHTATEVPEEQIRAIYRYYEHVLRCMVANPDARHEVECLLSPEEKTQILLQANGTSADYDFQRCLHHLIEAQANQVPDRMAVSFEGEHLSYGEMERKANQLANYLRGIGIRTGALVAVCMERSVEIVLALMGVLKAGAAYVPLDPEYPAERLAFMVGDSRAAVMLTQRRILSRISEINWSSCKTIFLDEDWKVIARKRPRTALGKMPPELAAYMIYTSGSTGRPKGAIISHRAICNHMLWLQREFHIGAEDRVLHRTPFSFDPSVWEFFATMVTGGQLVMARPGGHRDPAYLVEAMQKHDVSLLHLVPSVLRLLVEQNGLSDCRTLRHVFCGGEELPFDLQSRLFERTRAELTNLYGPTEATIVSTFWTCQRDGQEPVVRIGRPISNAKAYILDKFLAPVPSAVMAELYIGGAGVGRGYCGRPGLTAERFIPNHLSETPGDRLYKTGDLARFLPDGCIDFLGREDNQVKVRGMRIELGEIEAALGNYPGLKQTAVQVREEGTGLKRLVAYAMAEDEFVLRPYELRTFLKRRLPEPMIPAQFVILSEMPLTPNGKVDRSALPASPPSRPELEQPFREPEGKVEQAIASIWKQVLKLEKVGLYDNFFDLGGDSILMLHVLTKVRERFDRPVSMMELFRYTTVSTLADLLKKDGLPEAPGPANGNRAEKQRGAYVRQKEIIMSLRKSDE
jgi:amino acid adenylation domain-containing protein